jgi:eukaryotic-like serine/threonine-protein kinase
MSGAAGEGPVATDASIADRIDQLCDAFEDAWRRGLAPRIEDYLADAPENVEARTFRELLEVELAYLRRAGQAPDVEEFRARFPQLASVVSDVFERTLVALPGGESTLSPRTDTRVLESPLLGGGPKPRDAVRPARPPIGTPTSSGLRFEVLRSYARGGLGEVLVARDRELNREVALKQIQLDYADDVEYRARFVLEAEITGRLEHPGIVPVYGLGAYPNGRPFYAMRLIRGHTMKEAIERYHATRPSLLTPGEKGLQMRKLLARFIDICDALEYAHSLGIVHRDLKPANVMLGDYGETLVVDWGLAKVMGRPDLSSTFGIKLKPKALSQSTPTQVGAVVGTPQFMSPEQASGQTDLVGPHSDVYGLGATLYCLLTGRPPLANPGLSVEELLDRVEQGNFRPPRQVNSAVPKPLDAICRKAMALKPADRYPSARAVADDIEHWLADEPIAAEPDTRLQRAARWIRRHRAFALATAIGLLLISLVSITAVIVIDRQREIADQLAEDNGRLAIQQQKARAEADTAFRQARAAVDDLFTRVSEDTLINQPGMQGLRKDLLGKTLEYYKRFLDQRANDPAVSEELAVTLFRVGRIVDEFESPEQAVPYFRKAQLMQERLLADSPHDPKRLQALGDTQNGLGRALHGGRRFSAALDAFRSAKDLRQQVADLAPNDREHQRTLANSVMNIGLVEKDSGQFDAAQRDLQAAQTIRRTAISGGGDSIKLDRDLAMGFYNQALLDLDLKRPDEASKHFSEANIRFQDLAKRDRRDLSLQYLSAVCNRKLGDLKHVTAQPEEAVRFYGLARDGFTRLTDRNPDVSEYQAALAATYISLADGQELTVEIETIGKARGILGELVEAYPENAQFRRDRAVTLRTLAHLQHAAGQIDTARVNLRSALDDLTTLAARFPDNKDFADQLEVTRQVWKAKFEKPAEPRAL